MLSKVLAEKEAELARQEDYPGILAEKQKLLQEMEERIRTMEKEIRDTESRSQADERRRKGS